MNTATHRLAAGATLCLLSLLAACPGDETVSATQVTVQVDSDVDGLRRVKASVLPASGDDAVEERTFRIASGTPSGSEVSLPFSFGVVKGAADRFRVVIEGQNADGEPLVTQQARVRFRDRETLLLEVFLAASCLDMRCSDDETCVDGSCLAVREQADLDAIEPGGETSDGHGDSGDGDRDDGMDETPDGKTPVGDGDGDAGDGDGDAGDGDGDCTASTFFADADEDSYGDPNDSVEACVAPDGYVDNADDCCDIDEYAYPAQTTPQEVPVNCDAGDLAFDYDCDGELFGWPFFATGVCCGVYQDGWLDFIPDCGQVGTFVECDLGTCLPLNYARVHACL